MAARKGQQYVQQLVIAGKRKRKTSYEGEDTEVGGKIVKGRRTGEELPQTKTMEC